MNQEQYLQPQKLEKCKEDLLHEPLRLYKVEDIEFQQEFNSEQKERATLLLQNLIASSRYNTFNSIERVFEKYKKINEEGESVAAVNANAEQDMAEVNNNDLTCMDLAARMLNQLRPLELNAYLVRYKATGQLNEAANQYVGANHISVVVPSESQDKKYFTIADAGLLLPRLVTFEDKKDSEKIFFRNKYCQAIYSPDNAEYPYKFIVAAEIKNKTAGNFNEAENNKEDSSYEITDITHFDPYHKVLNPYSLLEDIVRTLPGYKITTQDKEGKNLALVSLDIAKRQIKFRWTDNNIQKQKKINFNDLSFFETEDGAEALQKTALQLGVEPSYITDNLHNIIDNEELYKNQILPPSVRQELENYERLQAYDDCLRNWIEKSDFNPSEKIVLDRFFLTVLPSYARGLIYFHEHDYSLYFSTHILINGQEQQIPLLNKMENDKENSFGNPNPRLDIKDISLLAKVLLDFSKTVKEKKDNLFWLKSRERYGDAEVLQNSLAQVWFNATEYDFENPVQFFVRQEALLRDQTFSDFKDQKSLGSVKSLEECQLVVRRISQSGSNETPFMMNIGLESEATKSLSELPGVRYAVEAGEQGEKTAYIFGIQRQKDERTDEASLKLKKAINRLLFKINSGVLESESDEFKKYYLKRKSGQLRGDEPYPENISDVSPSAVLSLFICLALLKKERITTVKAPGFLPIRWQGHEHLGKVEQARIQENVTDKFLRAFRRLAFHVPGIEIVAYPDDKRGYLEIKLGELNSNNPLFKEIEEVIK